MHIAKTIHVPDVIESASTQDVMKTVLRYIIKFVLIVVLVFEVPDVLGVLGETNEASFLMRLRERERMSSQKSPQSPDEDAVATGVSGTSSSAREKSYI